MNRKFLALAAVAAMSMAATSCSSDDNSLDCDDSYVSECLSDTHYMACTNGTLTVYQCVGDETCNSLSMCVGETVERCTVSVCKNDSILNKCVDGVIEEVSCDPNTCADGACTDIVNDKKNAGEVCDNSDECKGDLICDGVCKEEVVVPECTVTECKNDSILNKCVDGVIVEVNCDPNLCVDGVCTTIVNDKKDAGEVCDNSDECKGDLICDGVCKEEEVLPECTVAVCKNNSILNDCVDGVIVEVNCDPNTCADGACTDIVNDKKDAGEVCDNSDECKGDLICDGVCKEEVVIDPCEGVTCTGGESCNLGVCIPANAATIKFGDPCDETFADFCRGSEMLYCSSQGVVVVEHCDTGCSIVVEVYDDESTAAFSWCNGPAELCTEEGQTIDYCINDGEYGSFSSSYECSINTLGTYTAIDLLLFGIGEECDGVCNETLTACENAAVTSCSYDTKCEGDVYWSCFEFWGLVLEDNIDCTEDEGQCVVYTEDGYSEATCGVSCSVAGSSSVCIVDAEDGTYTEITTCAEADDGKLYDVLSYVDCAHGCNDDATGCKILVDDEGDLCDESFVDRCDGDIVVGCGFYGEVEAYDCSEVGAICGLVDGESGCYMPCSSIGEQGSICVSDYSGDAEAYTLCTSDENGKWIQVIDQESVKDCVTSCNEEMTACEVPETCDVDSYTDSCDGQTLSYCSAGNVRKLTCKEPKSCQVNGVGYGDCVETCDTPAEPAEVCIDKEGYKLHVAAISCELGSDGQHYAFNVPLRLCPAGCNETMTDCIPVETCDENYVETCDGQTLKYCTNDGYVDALDCEAPRSCQIHSSGYGDCFMPCDTVTDVSVVCIDGVAGYYPAHLVNTSCEPGSDGKNYEFTIPVMPIVICENGCNADNSGCK